MANASADEITQSVVDYASAELGRAFAGHPIRLPDTGVELTAQWDRRATTGEAFQRQRDFYAWIARLFYAGMVLFRCDLDDPQGLPVTENARLIADAVWKIGDAAYAAALSMVEEPWMLPAPQPFPPLVWRITDGVVRRHGWVEDSTPDAWLDSEAGHASIPAWLLTA